MEGRSIWCTNNETPLNKINISHKWDISWIVSIHYFPPLVDFSPFITHTLMPRQLPSIFASWRFIEIICSDFVSVLFASSLLQPLFSQVGHQLPSLHLCYLFPSAVVPPQSPSSVFKLLVSFTLCQILFLFAFVRFLFLFSSVLFGNGYPALLRLLFKINSLLFILPPGSQAVSAPESSFLATSYTWQLQEQFHSN